MGKVAEKEMLLVKLQGGGAKCPECNERGTLFVVSDPNFYGVDDTGHFFNGLCPCCWAELYADKIITIEVEE